MSAVAEQIHDHSGRVWSMPAAELVLRADASRHSWLLHRSTGIGGSDVAALVGLSEYKTRLGVYADKAGREDVDADSDAMEWGRRLEGPLAEWFTDKTGIATRRTGLIRSKSHPVAIASIDRLTDCTGQGGCPGPDGILECKSTSWRMAEAWDDDQTPDAAELQTVWYLGVSGRSHAHVVVIIDGRTVLTRLVLANPELFATLVDVAERFWTEHVKAFRPPEPTLAGPVLDEMKRLYPNADAPKTDCDARVLDPIVDELDQVKARIKADETRRDFLSAQVRGLIGPAIELYAQGVLRATCKEVTQNRIDSKWLKAHHPAIAAQAMKPTTYRQLLIKKAG